jgi:hypothetical protein
VRVEAAALNLTAVAGRVTTPAQGVLPTLPFQSQASTLPAPNLLASADVTQLPEGDLLDSLPPTGAGVRSTEPAPVAPVGIQPAVMTVETTTAPAGGSTGGAQGGARPVRAGFTLKPGSQIPGLPALSAPALSSMTTDVAPSALPTTPSPTADLPPAAQPAPAPAQLTAPAPAGSTGGGLLGGLGVMAGIGVLWASVRRIVAARRRDDKQS